MNRFEAARKAALDLAEIKLAAMENRALGQTPVLSVYRPSTNAVVVHLHEFQDDATGSLNRRLSYSIEAKDQHLMGDLLRLAQELMDKRGFEA